MVLLLILKAMPVTGWFTSAISYILWGNAIIGVILAVFACINWIGTDRSHEIFEAEAAGNTLRPCDLDQLARYDARTIAFGLHMLLCLALGFLGWWIAWMYIPIPSEDAPQPVSE
jgi:hypothetical protein